MCQIEGLRHVLVESVNETAKAGAILEQEKYFSLIQRSSDSGILSY